MKKWLRYVLVAMVVFGAGCAAALFAKNDGNDESDMKWAFLGMTVDHWNPEDVMQTNLVVTVDVLMSNQSDTLYCFLPESGAVYVSVYQQQDGDSLEGSLDFEHVYTRLRAEYRDKADIVRQGSNTTCHIRPIPVNQYAPTRIRKFYVPSHRESVIRYRFLFDDSTFLQRYMPPSYNSAWLAVRGFTCDREQFNFPPAVIYTNDLDTSDVEVHVSYAEKKGQLCIQPKRAPLDGYVPDILVIDHRLR